jgi:hypothetical protein
VIDLALQARRQSQTLVPPSLRLTPLRCVARSQSAAMTSIFSMAREDIHEAHPSVREGISRGESGKSALQGVYLPDGHSFWSSQRVNDTTSRQLGRPNIRER